MKAPGKQSAWFRGGVWLAALGWLAATQVAQAGFDFDEKGNPFCAGEALVTFKSGLNALTTRSIMTQAGVDPSKTYWFDTMQKFLAKKGKVTARQKALADQLARTAWVKFDERVDVLDFCDKMKANKASVAEATPNHIGELAAVPNDFFYGVQWPLRPWTKSVGAQGQNPPARLLNGTIGNFPDAWNIATGAGIRIAILDTGCDLLHGDLIHKIVFLQNAPGCLNAMPPGADNPPFSADPTKPWDETGHGTVVAGLIGAQWKNRKGITGAAPDAHLMIIKVTNGASVNPTQAALAAGINIAVVNNAHIINIGLHTGTVPNAAVLASILLAQTLNVTPVAAVGNYLPAPVGPPTAVYPTPTPPPYPIQPPVNLVPTGPVLTEPASYPGVIAVGGHPQMYDSPAYGSPTYYGWRGRYSYVTPALIVMGPGGIGSTPWHSPDQNTNWSAIFSTWPRYALPLTPLARTPLAGILRGRVFRDPADGSNDSYTFMDLTVTTGALSGGNNANVGGTSLAAAHVSGATALLKQKHPWFWPAQMLARHIRFADRADLNAMVNTNLPLRWYPTTPDRRLNPFDAIIFPPTTPPGRVQPGNVQLLINPPFNPYIGYGLLDAFRLVRGVAESPCMVNPTNINVTTKQMMPPTGYVRVFPWSPRDHFYSSNGVPVSTAVNVFAGGPWNNNLRQWESPVPGPPVPGPNFNLVLQVIVVDDHANLLNGRNPQVVARISPTIYVPQINVVSAPLPGPFSLLDDGQGNDLVANDGIFTGSATIPGVYATAPPGTQWPLRIQYFAYANGLLPNTNCIIQIRVQ